MACRASSARSRDSSATCSKVRPSTVRQRFGPTVLHRSRERMLRCCGASGYASAGGDDFCFAMTFNCSKEILKTGRACAGRTHGLRRATFQLLTYPLVSMTYGDSVLFAPAPCLPSLRHVPQPRGTPGSVTHQRPHQFPLRVLGFGVSGSLATLHWSALRSLSRRLRSLSMVSTTVLGCGIAARLPPVVHSRAAVKYSA